MLFWFVVPLRHRAAVSEYEHDFTNIHADFHWLPCLPSTDKTSPRRFTNSGDEDLSFNDMAVPCILGLLSAIFAGFSQFSGTFINHEERIAVKRPSQSIKQCNSCS